VYLKLISRFDLASKVPLNGEITFTNLAATVGVDRAALTSILRLGIAYTTYLESLVQELSHTLQLLDRLQKTAMSPIGSEPMLMICGPRLRKLSMLL
jgi:hypothetical protein